MTIITDIQIVDLPAAFPDAEQASYAWAQHRGITDSPLLGYAVMSTNTTDNTREVVEMFGVLDYAAAVLFHQKMLRIERNAMIQFNETRAKFAFRVVNVYNFDGKPTIVL